MLQTRGLEECNAVADPVAYLLVQQIVGHRLPVARARGAVAAAARIGSEGIGRETVSADWDRGA